MVIEAASVDLLGVQRFKILLEVATMREGSGIVLVREATEEAEKSNQPPPDGQEADELCSWWRRGRVESYREHGNSVLVAA